ncbi:hypothetical protein [Micromonospora sp. CPCC 206061]|uniref:hypothetical protein n=1 Tax=Micromonospora sp. CPCC 206061 TaxID=3122410 RepID=UPI002FEF71F7
MTTEPTPPVGAGTAPDRRGGLSWRRVLLVGAVAAVVGLAGAGIAGYLVIGGQEKARTSANCGTLQRCIPSLKAATVVDALTQRGHECAEQEQGARVCTLAIGETKYQALLAVWDGLIADMNVSVWSPEGREVTPGRLAYLFWFAALPYGDDPTLVGQIEGWITEKVEKLESAQATIGGYRYEITVEEARNLEIRVMAELR